MSLDAGAFVERGAPTTHERAAPESLRRLACLSVTHETVPSDHLAEIAPEDPEALAEELKAADRITEAVVLATCNRVEIYASTRTAAREDLEAALSVAYDGLGESEGVQEYAGVEVVEHLARVACGVESAILGEDQILGQVNRTFEAARRDGLAEGALSRAAETAVRVGRKSRQETAINDGNVSYGSAICDCIEGGLERAPERVLVVGAGEMSETAVTAMERRWDVRIDVANRSVAEELATDDGRYWPLDELAEAVEHADAVVTATGAPEPVLTDEHANRCDPGTPVVDLANPQDVAPEAHGRLAVTDLDDLAARVQQDAQARQEEVAAVETLIDGAIERFVTSERENRAEDVLRALHRKAARTREREVERAVDRLEDGDSDPEEVLADFANALTGQLLADPTEALREAAREGDAGTTAAARRLFDLEGEDL